MLFLFALCVGNGWQPWSGEGLSQIDFMQKDECILLDMNDNVIGMSHSLPVS